MARPRTCSDADLVRLNSMGYSLKTIADMLGVSPPAVHGRLKSLAVPPTDTRRSFMEDILTRMSADQQLWLGDQLGAGVDVKDFIHNLIIKEYLRRSS